MITDHLVLILLWIMYVLLHSVLAAFSIKIKMQKLLGKNYRFYRMAYTLFSFVFLAALLFYQVSIPTIRLFPYYKFLFIPGLIISVAGGMIMLVCIRKYFTSLSGFRTLIQEEASPGIMTGGIHRYVRHPLYLGTFIFIWGLFLCIPHLSLFIANTIITVYTLFGIKIEEKKLISEYGQQYLDYRKKVPKLIPRFKL